MTAPLDATERDPLEALAEEFVARYRRGEAPCPTEYALRHPELAGDILELFPAATLLEDMKGPPRAPQAPAPAPRQLGDYRIVREVGRGGMGVVYEAEQVSLGRRVALKVLTVNSRLGADQIERFRREAQAAGRLHHTNIVPVFGVGEDDGQHYYVMQFIPGQGLDGALARLRHDRQSAKVEGLPPFGGPVYERHIARLSLQVADALAYAHGQGVLHRDIKPANLLLDEQGNVWVTDFGLAKVLEHDDLTVPGQMAGTLRYSAPERFQGKGDARSDVFALGLTLYELVTLRPGYDEKEPARLLQQATHASFTPPRALNPTLARDLETVILRALDPEPARRYQSAAELADDLRRFLEDRPVRARRAGWAERSWRWCRRRPAVAGLSAALLLVLAAGFAGVAWKWREASSNFAEAREASETARKGLVREEQERRRAEEQGRRAEGNLGLALEAFDRIARQLVLARPGAPLETDGEGPAPPPVVSQEVAAILQDLVRFYERFSAGNASDPRLQRATATALRRVGTIRHRLGEHAKAEEAFRRAIGLLEQIAGQELELARTHNDLGVVLRGANKLPEALEEHRAALTFLDKLPVAPAVRLERATAHQQIGAVEWRRLRFKPAETSLKEAVALLLGLVKESPGAPEPRHRLARALHDLSLPMFRGSSGEALRLKQQALEAMEKLTADFPTVPDYRAELVEMLLSFSPRLFPGPGNREAVKRLGRAVDLAAALVGQYPTVPEYQSQLGRARQRLGVAQLMSNQSTEAIGNLRQSVALHRALVARFPTVLAHQFPLAEARLSLGEALRHKGPLPEAEKALRENVEELPRLLAHSPQPLFLRGLLSRSSRALGQVLLKQGKKAEGERMLKQADKLREKPKA